MKTLSDLLAERSGALQARLSQAASLQDSLAAIEEELRRFADLEGPYLPYLSKPQARSAILVLSALQQLLQAVRSLARESEPVAAREAQVAAGAAPGRLGAIVGAGAGAIVGAGAGAVVLGPPGAAVGAGLGSAAGLLIDRSVRARQVRDRVQPAWPKNASIASSTITGLREALQLTQQAVESVRPPSDDGRPGKPTAERPELLEFFQRLLGEGLDPLATLTPTMSLRMKELRELLRREQIQVLTYEPSKLSDRAEEYFDFEPSIDPAQSDYLTLLPALIDKNGTVLVPGRAVLPAVSPNIDGREA